MKLSQLLHKVSPTQVILITDYAATQPRKILAKGTRNTVPKDSNLNDATVITIEYTQAIMIVSVLQH